MQGFIKAIGERKHEYGVAQVLPYEGAVKFKAHDRLE